MRLHLVVATLALAGCSRSLDLPPVNTVTVTPALASVAPRESLQLQASGGSGGYTFRFATAGPSSGPGATIDAATGSYRAGATGSAQDVLEVVDAAGAVAVARISVGSRLAISPLFASAAPGGALPFTATGGKPPYTFALVRAQGSDSSLSAEGAYRAGAAAAGGVEQVVVSDATSDSAATATAEIRVGAALQIYPPVAKVAPREALPFVSFGGQPPYAYAIGAAGSLRTVAPTVGAVTGSYLAGDGRPAAQATDSVVVTDANGMTATATLTVGPALQASLPAAVVRPGAALKISASGGKPPYQFRFAASGNRSGGLADAITGDYVPGWNVNAIDLLEVVDAVGVVAAPATPPTIGPWQIDTGPFVQRCVSADLNGDGRGDVALLRYDDSGNSAKLVEVVTFTAPETGSPLTRVSYVPAGRDVDQVLAADVSGTGHQGLLFVRSGRGTAPSFWSMLPLADGSLGFGASATTAVTAPAAAWKTAAGTIVYSGPPCTPGTGTGLYTTLWPTGAAAPGAPACVAVPGFSGATSLLVGNWNGDAYEDLAWIAGSPPSLYVAMGSAAGFGVATAIPFPPGTQLQTPVLGDHEAFARATPGGVVVVTFDTGTRRREYAYWKAGTSSFGPPVDVFGPTGCYGYCGMSPVGGESFVAWTMLDGRVARFDVDAAGTLAAHDALAAPFAVPVRCAATADLDGDGTPDLVAATPSLSTATILWGEGDGTYGRRARFRVGAVAALGDLDGDLLGDVVAADGPALQVFRGSAHQLARAERVPTARSTLALAIGDVFGTGRPAVVLNDDTGAFYTATPGADGVLQAPVPLAVSGAPMSWRRIGLSPARGAAGPDLYGLGWSYSAPNNYYLVHHYDRTGTAQATIRYGTQIIARSCAFLPAAAREYAALCSGDGAGITLYQMTVSDAAVSAWTSLATTVGEGGASNASMVPAGTLPDGRAVFVAGPGSNGAVSLSAVVVEVSAGTMRATWIPLPGVAGPVQGATLGLLETGDGVFDLAVQAGGRVFLFRGDAGATAFTPLGAPVGAAGVIVGAIPLAAGVAADVLVTTGLDLVPLRNDGTGTLR